MNGRNLLILLVLGAAIVVTVFIAWPKEPTGSSKTSQNCPNDANQKTRPDQGFCAPNFRLPDQTGEIQELHQNNGKPTLINFWATWCDPCLTELPYLEAAYKKHGDQVNFWMINATSTEPNEKEVFKFIDKYKYTFPILLDERETNVAFGQYKLVGLPVTIAIDAKGKIIYKHAGELNEKELAQILKKIDQST